MHNNSTRPRYLNLLDIRLPPGGVVSILHRVSGIALVMLLPFAIYLLDRSLDSEQGFQRVTTLLAGSSVKILVALGAWFLLHHLLAGLRHLLLDLDFGIGREAGRRSAWLILMFGMFLWITGVAWWW